MQTCTVDLRLNDSNDMIVRKYLVTPAEYLLLAALHGAGALVGPILTADVERTAAAEFDRLMQVYGGKREAIGQNADPQRKTAAALIQQSFGGLRPNIPATFAEIDVVIEGAAPSAGQRRGRKPAAAAEPGTEAKAGAELNDLMA